MGGNNSKTVQYGVYVGEKKEGETRILRHPDVAGKELSSEPFPGVNTIWKAFEYAVNLHGNRPFLGTRKFISKDHFGDYEFKTFNEIMAEVKDFAAGLSILELTPEVESPNDGIFKFLGIYSKNREEWIVADLAAHQVGATVVTLYDTLGESTIDYILDQSKLTTLVLESKSLKKILHLHKEGKTHALKNLILLDVEDEAIFLEVEQAGFRVFRFPEIIAAGKGQKVEFTPCTPETIATFCYTSGTTGTPKGAMIPHKGLLASVSSIGYTSIAILETDVHLSYLPLAHILERAVFTACMLHCCAIGFYSGNSAKIMDDAQNLKPTIFIGVPRIYQRVYEVITGGMAKLGMIKKALADRAVTVKLENYRKNGDLTNSIWDRLIFNKSKNALGGRVRFMLTGSAPIAQDMLEFLKICFCCPILEGYGQTESCAAVSLTAAEDIVGGHVGGPVSACEIKLLDVPSLNYLNTDVNEDGIPRPRGEICVRGNILFAGYYNDPENTKKTVDTEGWIHTGDVGAILPHGNALKIIDRVKNIFKLCQGEYIAPEKLENILIKSKYVAQIFVHGESIESYLIAVVVPKPEACIEFLKTKGIECNKDNVHDHYNNKDLIADVLKDMETLGRKSGFTGFEVIKKIILVAEPFSIDNNLLTPTMKVKRNEAKNKYDKELKELYASK